MEIKFSPKLFFSPNFRYQFHPDFWRDNAVVVSAPKFFTCHVTVWTVTREFNYKPLHIKQTIRLFGCHFPRFWSNRTSQASPSRDW